ncbi:MerR family transcriptional regulator [Limnochorda pilosa]|uniref:MerR family transcriptional regulator n=1 Tax=Limnochorda pilosa TaxID=1555112 RepID=A0A0K2SQE9_LIMPI|nr:MerR family transcriptional regulator [Limnochorda pilosa]BAS29350.1 MerR family transcriptional regulator [Limnochorda pilosa]
MRQTDPDTPLYSIGVVERLTGLTARQIRYYEEVGLLEPARSPGNHRIYSPREVDLLLSIKSLTNQGFNLEGVRVILQQRPTGAPQEGGEPEPDSRSPTLGHPRRLSSLYPVNNREDLQTRLETSLRKAKEENV